MAIGLKNYPRIESIDSDYPDGQIKDRNGTVRGTPVNKLTNADMHQFFAKLMREAGVEPNGVFDNEYSGNQFWEALDSLNSGLRTKVINIGAWDMTSPSTILVPHGVEGRKIRSVSAVIFKDDELDACYTLPYIDSSGIQASVYIQGTNVLLFASSGGVFDTGIFASTSENRGFITIHYLAD